MERAFEVTASQTAVDDTSTTPTFHADSTSAMQPITLLLIATSLVVCLGLVGASVWAVTRSGSAHHHSAGTDAASRTDDSSPPERQRWQRQQQERSQNN